MSDTSPVLALPYIKPSQAQKHVTHNEALRVLDALVQLSVLRVDLTAPPATPAPGARYIVAGSAADAWEGMENHLAIWDETWIFHAPRTGWCAYVEETGRFVLWDGAAWRDLAESFDTLERLGLNATPDATNRLALSSPASLFSHEGAGHRLKAGATDTASLLFQTDWSGRAEMGTMGADAFGIKVSTDGALWTDAMTIDPATGRATLPQGAQIEGAEINGDLSGTAVQASASDATAGKLMTVGAFGLGKENHLASDLDTALPTGFYLAQSPAANRYLDTNGYLLNQRDYASFASQLCIAATGSLPSIGVRRQIDGTWEDWTNILPETGSNSNGTYVRFADGTQICHAIGFHVTSNPTFWTFPAAFNGVAPTLTLTNNSLSGFRVYTGSVWATGANISCFNSNGVAATGYVFAMAIGPWK